MTHGSTALAPIEGDTPEVPAIRFSRLERTANIVREGRFHTEPVSIEDVTEVIAALEADMTPAGKKNALVGAKLLTRCFPTLAPNDVAGYLEALVEVMEDFPVGVIKRVVSTKTGLPATSKWPPAIAEVRSACAAVLRERSHLLFHMTVCLGHVECNVEASTAMNDRCMRMRSEIDRQLMVLQARVRGIPDDKPQRRPPC
jgi:hypothetical protein